MQGKWEGTNVQDYWSGMEKLAGHGLHLVKYDMEYYFQVPEVIDQTVEPSDFDKAITILVHRELGWKPKVSYEITPGIAAEIDRIEAAKRKRHEIPEDSETRDNRDRGGKPDPASESRTSD